jgi:hypothetical protein
MKKCIVRISFAILTLVIAGIGFTAETKAQSKQEEQAVLTGKVVETMNSGGYTYVRLESAGKKTWVAIPEAKVKMGQTISFLPGMEMQNFESKTLNRKFDSIIFSGGIAGNTGTAAQPKDNGSKGKVVAAGEKITVEKASGQNAYTVADIYKNSKSLSKKQVVVRGKVVKVSAGIIQRNWIHIQDGTGDAQKGTNNLVTTSSELAAVGDIVTATGTLVLDKDFGSGYKYAVIIENTKYKK